MSAYHFIFSRSRSAFFALALALSLGAVSGCNVFDFDPNGGGCGYQGGWYLGGPCPAGTTPGGAWKKRKGILPVKVTDEKIQSLSHRYGIQRESAGKILLLAAGRISSGELYRLGLKSSDVRWLKTRTMPTQSVIDRIAGALGEEPATIGQLIEDFILSS